jgi:hypothetical protein
LYILTFYIIMFKFYNNQYRLNVFPGIYLMAKNNPVELPDVLLTSIRDGVVSDRTRLCYVNEIFSFLLWLRLNEPSALTTYGLSTLDTYVINSPLNATNKQIFSKNKVSFGNVLRECSTAAVLELDVLSPDIYMNYCRSLRNKKSRLYLGMSTIGVKRLALFHLYRLHNGAGYPEKFKLGLNNLFRGFFRVLTSRRPVGVIVGEDGPEVVLPKWNQVCVQSIFFLLFEVLTQIFFTFIFIGQRKGTNECCVVEKTMPVVPYMQRNK